MSKYKKNCKKDIITGKRIRMGNAFTKKKLEMFELQEFMMEEDEE